MGGQLDWIIQGGSVVLPGETRRLDIGIRDGEIAVLRDKLNPAEAKASVDAAGKLVLPGMIDVHVHFNEPNLGHWEGFETGSAALAAGGCTLYADMPLNGNPPTVTLEALRMKERLAAEDSLTDYSFWGGLMPGYLDRIEELAAAGVIGFKAFMSNPGGEGEGRFREVDRAALYEGMKRIAAVGGILALHAESEDMTSSLAAEAVAAGRLDARAFAASRPPAAELEAVSEALELAEQTGCRLHFVHISTPEAVDLIDEAKRRGLDVTLETCPHYLALTVEDMERLGPAAKCAPPLRDEARREELWKRVAEGKIDWIASDHSPCPADMKQPASGSYFEAWGGIAGAQSSLELMFEEGCVKRGLPLHQLAALLSAHPADRFGFRRKGRIAEGYDADLVLLDPGKPYTLTVDDLRHRHKHSPYIGRTFSGKVSAVYCRGNVIYSEAGGTAAPGGGVWIKPGGREWVERTEGIEGLESGEEGADRSGAAGKPSLTRAASVHAEADTGREAEGSR
ncbi:allantoinase [Paenibacillus yonginensis]|uniref:allantoinase n=1 Tax=Paenibacillus yonginensis TaxID=1462996 RepID=UPI0008388D6A|nr:allantoinase [Paenibacillus yonginensis]